MSHAPTKDPEVHTLFQHAGAALQVDAGQLKQRIIHDAMSAPSAHPRRAALLAAAAATVVGVGVGGLSLLSPAGIGPAGGGDTTATMTAPTRPSSSSISSTTTPTTPPAPPAPPAPPVTSSATTSTPKPPLLRGHVSLPANQRYADYEPVSSGWHVKGTARGIGRVHVDSRPHNVILVPGTLPNDGNRPAMCFVVVDAAKPIDEVGREIVKIESCGSTPRPGGTAVRGHLSLGGGSPEPVDEWQSWDVIQVAASTKVQRVDLVYPTVTYTLQHRYLDKGWPAAYFIGFVPKNVAPGSLTVHYYNAAGAKIAEESLR